MCVRAITCLRACVEVESGPTSQRVWQRLWMCLGWVGDCIFARVRVRLFPRTRTSACVCGCVCPFMSECLCAHVRVFLHFCRQAFLRVCMILVCSKACVRMRLAAGLGPSRGVPGIGGIHGSTRDVRTAACANALVSSFGSPALPQVPRGRSARRARRGLWAWVRCMADLGTRP